MFWSRLIHTSNVRGGVFTMSRVGLNPLTMRSLPANTGTIAPSTVFSIGVLPEYPHLVSISLCIRPPSAPKLGQLRSQGLRWFSG